MSFSRTLEPGQTCRILVADPQAGTTTVVFESDTTLFEAPNWTHTNALILNGDGVLWRLDLEGDAAPQRIAIDNVPELNNDHVLAPDGETIYLSANDWHIYAAPLAGGTARRITADNDGRMHFLHGVSPDGATLAYIGVESRGAEPDSATSWFSANVFTHALGTSADDIPLTFGNAPADGSEYSPDGAWIYFNTEQFSDVPGHAQIARLPAGGGEIEQLTFDERVNWFPHIVPRTDPAGKHSAGAQGAARHSAVYLSFPPATVGHPANKNVELRLVDVGDWGNPRVFAELFGGQGTINVNSWSPDGRRFAYVDYPLR
jgi:TolB protein